jgi:ATP-dependent protease ClpP protease subunit
MRVLLTLLLLITGTLSSAQTLQVPADRTIRMLGEVDSSYLGIIQRIDTLSKLSDAPIFLLINSPGGSIFVGNLVIDAMNVAKSRGVEFHCASTLLAASMAFQFFVHCDHRYAMKHTKLLFHPPRIMYMGILLPAQLKQWVKELEAIESKMIPEMQAKLGMDSKLFAENYNAETLWDAEDLNAVTEDQSFLTLIDDIEGISNIFQYNPTPGQYRNELIWISERLLNFTRETK